VRAVQRTLIICLPSFMTTKVNPTPQRRQPPSSHSSSATGWKVANERLCSVLAHPFGFPLLLLFDLVERCEDREIQTWDEFDLGKIMDLVYLGANHLNLLEAIKDVSSACEEITRSLGHGIRSWHKDRRDRTETTLTNGISDDLNKIWTVRNRLVSDSEGRAVDDEISGRQYDVVLYHAEQPPFSVASSGHVQQKSTVATEAHSADVLDKQAPAAGNDRKRTRSQRVTQRKDAPPKTTPEQTREKNQAVALLEFGHKNNIWWKKLHQCSQYADQKLAGKSMDEPLLTAVVTYDLKKKKQNSDSRLRYFFLGISKEK
jgi:hypothetical protein